MSCKTWLFGLKDRTAYSKRILFVSAIYNFVWAICKIIFGALTGSYFFCVSGASNLLFAFIKHIYLKHFESEDVAEKRGKSIIISILLIASSVLFTFYMSRLFFIDDIRQYDMIMSITMATSSFVELGFAIFKFIKSKQTNDILLQSFRGCNLASSCFAIVLTQVALHSATKTSANLQNAITGVIFGGLAILIGVYILIKAVKVKN